MGRHRWTNRLTVEDCPRFLCAASCHIFGVFTSPLGSSWRAFWIGGEDAPLGSIEYHLTQSGPTGLALYLRRQCVRLNVIVEQQLIPVGTVRPHLGGKRFWFQCGCGKRVGRLYMPPGQQVFRCRHCYNLTYRSAQTHDQRLYDLARDPLGLRTALDSEKSSRALLGVRAIGVFMAQRRRRLGQSRR